MVSRVELMNSISSKNNDEIFFPRSKSQTTTFELPNDAAILATVKRAKRDALENAKRFGIVFSESEVESTELKRVDETNNGAEDYDDDGEGDEDNVEEDRHDDSESLTESNSAKNFVHVELDGCIEKVRKSRLVWLLTDSKEKLSSDRLKRVQGPPEKSSQKLKRKKIDDCDNSQERIEVGE